MADIDIKRLRELLARARNFDATISGPDKTVAAEFIGAAYGALPALLALAEAVQPLRDAEQLLRKSAKEHEDAADGREMDDASRRWQEGLSHAYEDGADMIAAALVQVPANGEA